MATVNTMNNIPSLDTIAKHLTTRQALSSPQQDQHRRAAVAMILEHHTDLAPRMLMIQRATDVRDPWSGHLAFPGGRVEQGEQLHDTAERETLEEIGLPLASEQRLGRLDDIIGTNLPVTVSCFVYGFATPVPPFQLNHEVHDAFWVPVSELTDPERHIITEVHFDDRSLRVPAIQLNLEGKPVLWGITYRLVTQFMQLTGIGFSR